MTTAQETYDLIVEACDIYMLPGPYSVTLITKVNEHGRHDPFYDEIVVEATPTVDGVTHKCEVRIAPSQFKRDTVYWTTKSIDQIVSRWPGQWRESWERQKKQARELSERT